MSYDLFFLVPDDREPISRQAFREYFARRKWYQIQGEQAWYNNENTGVYFAFDYGDPEVDSDISDDLDLELEPHEDIDEPDDGLHSANVMFNVNYFRPHTFGMEAEIEVSLFVAHFDLSVDDPQNSGMGRGTYTPNGFITGWNAGNEFGFGAMIAQIHEEGAEPLDQFNTLPSTEIERYWRWNYHADALQDSLGEGVFVSQVMFLKVDDQVQSAVVWGDAMPIAIPRTDLIVLVRDELAPKKGIFRRKSQDYCIVEASGVVKNIRSFVNRQDHDEPFHLLQYDEPPAEVLDYFEQAIPEPLEQQGVPVDQLLDRESIEKAAAAVKSGAFKTAKVDE